CKRLWRVQIVIQFGNSLVVDLDLRVQAHIIVDEHLLAAYQRHQTDFPGVEPTKMQVSANSTRILQRHKNDVFDSVAEIRKSSGHHGYRFLFYPVVHDGYIVRCEAPQGAYVVLDPAKVHPLRIHIEDPAKLLLIKIGLDSLHRGVEFENVAYHEHPPMFLG